MSPSAPPSSKPLFHVSELFLRRRRKTRPVRVGAVEIGGTNKIRLQSMTTTLTRDVEATAAQTLRMVEAGCEIVRITTPTVNDARALGPIREAIERRGVSVPLVADIHFDPSAAMEAAEFADKVRINPGNFIDSKRFAVREYSDAQYAEETARLEERFTPLVEKLKRLGRALRIGTNHGSLSDRIMNRYGDSPLGMVESALEYMRVCRQLDYHDIIFSMKASNPKVMIAAYRLLAARLAEIDGANYPFHLGVTEAGDGEDGRVKSAVGMGSLLEDGIGDTVRVSLTEEPELEIPVCRLLAQPYHGAGSDAPSVKEDLQHCDDVFDYKRRATDSVRIGPFRIGGAHPVRVLTRWSNFEQNPGPQLLAFLEEQLQAAQALEPEIIEWELASPEDVTRLAKAKEQLSGETSRLAHLARTAGAVVPQEVFELADAVVWGDGILDEEHLLRDAKKFSTPLLIESARLQSVLSRELAARSQGVPCIVTLANDFDGSRLHAYRRLAARLRKAGSKTPIHIKSPGENDFQSQTLRSATLMGSLLCDGIGDSVQVITNQPPKAALRLVYAILQAAGVRITKTEYVSCPSCGRTLFDLQETTERIKSQTGHLKGVKIAIMGCIVNGPGEMADADFGYVGGAPGKINLYVGKECVHKGIPSEQSDQALIDLIKSHGKWTDPR
jgi:(E)-4-hydroxy-3-methylbut-2-enyl-diphosphate synthase